MWIMTSYGILMPADLPTHFRPLARPNWDMQVRSRDKQTLVKLRLRMNDRGFVTGAIRSTRGMDYEYRFYCARADFAKMIAADIMEIDYDKFKPTTERHGMGGRRLHNLYNHIWFVVARHYNSPILTRDVEDEAS